MEQDPLSSKQAVHDIRKRQETRNTIHLYDLNQFRWHAWSRDVRFYKGEEYHKKHNPLRISQSEKHDYRSRSQINWCSWRFIYLRYEHFPDDYDHLIELKKLIKELDTSGYDGIKQQAFKWIERDLERALRRFQKYEHDPDIVIKED